MALNQIQKIILDRYTETLQESTYLELSTKLTEKIFSPKNLGISYRELNHWASTGLLLESSEFGKMRRFSVIELVWIEMLKELRNFSLSLPTIKKLKENLGITISLAEILESDDRDVLLDVVRQQNRAALQLNPDDAIPEEDLEELFKDETFSQELAKQEFNLFQMLLFQVYILKIDFNILVNSGGFWSIDGELIHTEITAGEYYIEHFKTSHISISISSLLSRIFQDFKPVELNFGWKLISDSEQKVLDLLRLQTNIKSVTVRLSKDAKIDLLEYTQELKVSPSDYLKKIIIAGGYERIEIITQKGNLVHCEKTVRYKV